MGPFLHHCNTNGHLALNFESHSLQNKGLLGIIKQQSCEGTLSLNRNQGYSQEKGEKKKRQQTNPRNGKELLSLKY